MRVRAVGLMTSPIPRAAMLSESRLEASPTLDAATKARESQRAYLDLTSHICFLS
jgi:hypothetical protein